MATSLLVKSLAILISTPFGQAEPSTGTWVPAPKTPDGTLVYYASPSICDALPALRFSQEPCTSLTMQEDNWRQIEFVPASNRDLVESMLKSLIEGFSKQPAGGPFSACFVRYEYPKSLKSANIQFRALVDSFSDHPVQEGLCLQSALAQGQVPTGFALEIPEIGWLYGTRVGDNLDQLGLLHKSFERPILDEKMLALLSTFLKEHRLIIVNWYTGQVNDTVVKQ